jgi:hypothetical protein
MVCKLEGCEKKLGPTNKYGYCKDHRHLSTELKLNIKKRKQERGYGKKDYWKHREKRLTNSKKYYHANKKPKVPVIIFCTHEDCKEIANHRLIKLCEVHYQEHRRKKIKEYFDQYYKENSEIIINRSSKWNKDNKESRNLRMQNYTKLRHQEDIQYKLSKKLRNRLNMAVRKDSKKGSAVIDLGCTIEELKWWLEFWFEDGMSWDNYGKNGWHIDHIKPLVSFDLTDRNQFLKAVNYKNLQPMWAKDNMSKHSKVWE